MTIDNLSSAMNVIVLDDVFRDPAWLGERFAANGPYWNQGRYLSAAGAASQMPGGATSTVGVPWYRQDWALGGAPLVDGAQEILALESFVHVARRVFAGTVVRPHTVYANVQVPAIGTDFGHTDVPEFRGITRDRYPVALLHIMNRSGLFRHWQLDICTAVSWRWDGPGGDFVLWTNGPDDAPERYTPPLTNRAVVSDNDRVFHAVGDFADPDGPASSDLTPTSEVMASDDGWLLRDGARDRYVAAPYGAAVGVVEGVRVPRRGRCRALRRTHRRSRREPRHRRLRRRDGAAQCASRDQCDRRVAALCRRRGLAQTHSDADSVGHDSASVVARCIRSPEGLRCNNHPPST